MLDDLAKLSLCLNYRQNYVQEVKRIGVAHCVFDQAPDCLGTKTRVAATGGALLITTRRNQTILDSDQWFIFH